MSLIVNLFAGPGAGKSTTAAGLFHELKRRGIRAELIGGYAKEWAWDERRIRGIDEMVIYGHQLERERRFYDKDMIVISDRPLELSAVYAQAYGTRQRAAAIQAIIDSDRELARELGAHFLNVKLHRQKSYDPVGRYEDLEQARTIDALCDYRVLYEVSYADQVGIPAFTDTLISTFEAVR